LPIWNRLSCEETLGTRVAGENAGIYAINQGTLAASSNYALTFVQGRSSSSIR
jgi:hypothetical protein